MDVDGHSLNTSENNQTGMSQEIPFSNDTKEQSQTQNNLSVSNLAPGISQTGTSNDDLNRRLLNAKLPEGAYELVRDVPKDFLQANFDPVSYVDQKLKSSAFSPALLDNLIKDADQMLESLDEQIAESLEIDPAPVPPSMDSAQELLKNLVVLGKKADESRQKAVSFAQQLQKLQNARKQLDTLALQIALCKLFKDEAKQLDTITNLHDIKEQLHLIKSVHILHLAEHELHGLRDTPQLQDSFLAFDKFIQEINKLQATCKHTDDSFNFWSQQAIILGYKAAIGQLQKYYHELSTQLMREAFPELFDNNNQYFHYLKRVSAFLNAHKHYMKDLEAPVIDTITESMRKYIDIQQRYGQINEQESQIQTGDFYKHFCDTLLQNIMSQAKSFAQRVVIDVQNVDIMPNLNQQNNNGQQKLLTLQSQLEQLEQQLAQDPDSGIRAGAIAGWCPESTDMILNQLQLQIKNIVTQQITECYKQVSDTSTAMLQILSVFEQFPHEGNAEQGSQLLQQLSDDVQVALPTLLEKLDFSQYVTQKVERQINGIRAGHNGSFYKIFKGISLPLLKLQSFNCGTLIFIDPSVGDARHLCMQTLINLRQLDEVFAKAMAILQGRVYFKAEEVRNPYKFSEVQSEAQIMATQALIQVLVGGFHVGVFCGGSRGRPQAIVAAKDALLVQLEQVQESGVIGVAGDLQNTEFRLQLSNTIIEQVGTIFVGNLIRENFSSSDIQLLLNTIQQLDEELDKDHIGIEGSLLRLKLALNTKILASEGAVPSRAEFQALASGIDGAQQWYDEMCLGIFQH